MPAAGERQNPSVYYSGVSWALGLIAAINRRNFFADLLQLQADFYTGLFLKSYMSDYWLVIKHLSPLHISWDISLCNVSKTKTSLRGWALILTTHGAPC